MADKVQDYLLNIVRFHQNRHCGAAARGRANAGSGMPGRARHTPPRWDRVNDFDTSGLGILARLLVLGGSCVWAGQSGVLVDRDARCGGWLIEGSFSGGVGGLHSVT